MNDYDMERRLRGALDERDPGEHREHTNTLRGNLCDNEPMQPGRAPSNDYDNDDNIPRPDRDFDSLGARLRFYAVALAIGWVVYKIGEAVLAYYF